MTLFFFAFGPGQDLRKAIYPLVDRVIRDLVMNITTLDMVLLEMSIKKSIGVMFYFSSKTKIQGNHMIT